MTPPGPGPAIGLTQFQPGTPGEVLRGERPKRVLVSFARSKETPSGKRPHQAGKQLGIGVLQYYQIKRIKTGCDRYHAGERDTAAREADALLEEATAKR